MSARARTMGVDLGSSKCGWAVVANKKRIDSGVWTFGAHRPGIVLVHMIVAKAVELRVTQLAYEAVSFHQSAAASHQHGELRAGVFQANAVLGFSPLIEVMTSTIKKTATGNGNAKKPMVVQAAAELFGVLTRLEDEAEALWCAVAAELASEVLEAASVGQVSL